MLSFDPLLMLLWVVISCGIPGALISLAIFKNDKHLNLMFIEKILIGFGVGIILLPLLPFTLYLFLGIKYTYFLALLSMVLLYVIGIALMVKAYKDDKENFPKFSFSIPTIPTFQDIQKSQNLNPFVLSTLLVLLLIVTYNLRMSTYSPVYQELDPYYYMYIPQQILTLGHNPFDDKTAWYPEEHVSHREVPALSYLVAQWYSYYTGGGAYDNLLFYLSSCIFPPLMAVLMVFSVYLIITTVARREIALMAAGLIAFVPLLIFKMNAGGQQGLPYTFFALPFFYALYALALKSKDLRYGALAALALLGAALGSNAYSLIITTIMFFAIPHAILLFIWSNDVEKSTAKNESKNDLKYFFSLNALIFVVGSLLGKTLMMDFFHFGNFQFLYTELHLVPVLFTAVLYLILEYVPEKNRRYHILGGLLILALVAMLFTPLGSKVKEFGQSFFSLAGFNSPLSRTIAEQGLVGGSLGSEIGFIASPYSDFTNTIFLPLRLILGNNQGPLEPILNGVTSFLSFIFNFFSIFVNLILAMLINFANSLLGVGVEFSPKENSFLLFWIMAFWVSVVWAFIRTIKEKKDNYLPLLFFAMVMPPLLVGIIKSKLLTYAAAMLPIAIGFSLGFFEPVVMNLMKAANNENTRNDVLRKFTYLAIFLVLSQFIYHGIGPSLVWASTQTRFQDNPTALVGKFMQFCKESSDPTVCQASIDPIGYANKGITYQYNTRLCLLSLLSNQSSINLLGRNTGQVPIWEEFGSQQRCGRISDYWIDSMEWVRKNTPENAYVISWWDYGHWINYFGQRNSVLRN